MELRIEACVIAPHLAQGESVAVDGACLTVETHTEREFTVFASPETIRRTALSALAPGGGVNLERALAVGDRLGGHLVQGHVDGTGVVRSITAMEGSWEVWFEAPEEIVRQSVEKGSIAVSGISLTIAALRGDGFSVWVIPETWRQTTLSTWREGTVVNLEVDLISKYVARHLHGMELVEGGEESLSRLWGQFRSK